MTLSAPASSLKDRLLERPQVYALVQAATQLTGMSHLRALFREFVDDRAYDSVLELGCGTGLWPVTRYRRFLRTDVNARYFPVAPPAGMEFRLADATDLSPLSGETFDLVYSFGLFHHLPDASVVASLREAALVLRPGGRHGGLRRHLAHASLQLPRAGPATPGPRGLRPDPGSPARSHPLHRDDRSTRA